MTQENKIPVSYRFNTAKEWSNGFLESKVNIEEGILPVVTGYILYNSENDNSLLSISIGNKIKKETYGKLTSDFTFEK